MAEFTMEAMLEMQRRLQERYRDRWEPIIPETGGNKMLYMLGECGEVIDILKKRGPGPIMNDPAVRADFVEELADVLMYYADVMLSFGITSQELQDAYEKKFERNMNRW